MVDWKETEWVCNACDEAVMEEQRGRTCRATTPSPSKPTNCYYTGGSAEWKKKEQEQ